MSRGAGLLPRHFGVGLDRDTQRIRSDGEHHGTAFENGRDSGTAVGGGDPAGLFNHGELIAEDAEPWQRDAKEKAANDESQQNFDQCGSLTHGARIRA